MDLSATVQGITATLTRYGVKRVYGDRLTGQWIVEAFKACISEPYFATCDSVWLLGGMLEAALRRLEDQP